MQRLILFGLRRHTSNSFAVAYSPIRLHKGDQGIRENVTPKVREESDPMFAGHCQAVMIMALCGKHNGMSPLKKAAMMTTTV